MSVSRRFGNPYRLASYVLGLYAMGHTAGALISTPKFGTAADAVATSMKSVHFEAQGFETSWYGFYLGFGWFVSLFFIVCDDQLVHRWTSGRQSRASRRHHVDALFVPMPVALLIAAAVPIRRAPRVLEHCNAPSSNRLCARCAASAGWRRSRSSQLAQLARKGRLRLPHLRAPRRSSRPVLGARNRHLRCRQRRCGPVSPCLDPREQGDGAQYDPGKPTSVFVENDSFPNHQPTNSATGGLT